ncbi:MAG: excinuclease ABC subunit UvrC [Anaerovoracaceae bacterium]|nr:excinuclease ABC subunit UvrC [Bacillota bacterium]MDY2670552.1 excinuclease ABC subunit UvrC [Anaerovoracaceae bacterium]
MFDIEKNIKRLPEKPGVYLHRDKLGHVIYVGKAVNLKNRVTQYFRSQTNMPAKVRAMVSHIEEFEYITTDSEYEALILECNLIKKYQPKYNVLLRDDKTYPYIKVTLADDYPRVVKTRRVIDDGAEYFGPYSDVGAVNETIDLLNSEYQLKRCSSRVFPPGFRPCLNYHIDQCRGICTGSVSREEYRKAIDDVLYFLKGHNKKMIDMLTQRMQECSKELNFERAAEYRDKIRAVKAIGEKQKVVLGGEQDMDIIHSAKSKKGYHIVLFYVRNGKLSGRDSFHMEASEDDERAEIIEAFMKQYYTPDMMIPKEIITETPLPDTVVLEKWLTEMRGAHVKVYVPQKGDKRKLLEMTRRDVLQMMTMLDERVTQREERRNIVSEELASVFGKRTMKDETGAEVPVKWRIESYDISNINGVDSVGGMVVFEDGKPQRRDYRKFKIRTVEGADDYSSMQEVIYRRFRRAEKGDPGFSRRPDIIFVDGGLGHVHAVNEILDAMGENITVAGMVKDDKHRTRGLIVDEEELDLKSRPVLFRYVTTIQDEVHRFAIGYHHNLRNKSMQKSVLDEVPGIGPARKKALLSEFGSIDKMKQASVDELAQVDGMNTPAAEELYKFLSELG